VSPVLKIGDFARIGQVSIKALRHYKAGTYVGRIAIRATGSCNLKTSSGTIAGIHVRYCQPLQRGDGYSYQKGEKAFPPDPLKGRGVQPQLL
jgi:hypothetical protein